jgi:hypothetical protein
MQSPTTPYRHGYGCDRRGSSTGVKSYFLLPILGWEVKTCHYTHHATYCFATNYPRGKIRQGPYPTISGIRPYPPILDPSSTQPRPTSGQQGGKGRRGIGLRVFSPSRPLRHNGVRGWPAIPEACRYSNLHRDRQNFTSSHPRRPGLLLPYKKVGQGSTRRGR